MPVFFIVGTHLIVYKVENKRANIGDYFLSSVCLRPLFSLFILLTLCACSDNIQKETKAPVDKEDQRKLGFGSIAGEDFLTFGPGKKSRSGQMMAPTVNPYLWRASLDTINFMPLTSADAMGGVIVTDWYVTPQNQNERLKATVFIKDQVLRADALKVIVYKQTKLRDGSWANSNSDPAVATELENIILTKARQLRVNSLGDK